MFELKKILAFEDIVIQCHDNPDADTIACGFALYSYLLLQNKRPMLIYGGPRVITKANLLLLIHTLKIPIEHVSTLHEPDLIITVDCQYGQQNVTLFKARNIAILDHHICTTCQENWIDIRPHLGSCSSLLWLLLKENQYDFSSYPNVCTALYYGLFTDTNNFAELHHPLDREIRDTIYFDPELIKKLQKTNLSIKELEIAGITLLRHFLNTTYRFAIFKSHDCDPNILGFISDLAIQVDSIDTCIVYTDSPNGIKYSIRSCTNEIRANELASYIASNMGSGGGHAEKAGGLIPQDAFRLKSKYDNVDEYLLTVTREYFGSFDILYFTNLEEILRTMKLYEKKSIVAGFIPVTTLIPDGSPFLIRTLENDIEAIATPNLFILIESSNKITCISSTTFLKTYLPLDTPYVLLEDYMPYIKNLITEELFLLNKNIKSCTPANPVLFYAKKLLKNIKLFPPWAPDQYILGYKDDYLVMNKDNPQDIFIVKKSSFLQKYKEML